MDYNNATYPIEVRVSGDSIRDLKAAAKKIAACMHQIEGINLIRTNYEEPLPGIRVTPDATEANRLGVNKTLLRPILPYTLAMAFQYPPLGGRLSGKDGIEIAE